VARGARRPWRGARGDVCVPRAAGAGAGRGERAGEGGLRLVCRDETPAEAPRGEAGGSGKQKVRGEGDGRPYGCCNALYRGMGVLGVLYCSGILGYCTVLGFWGTVMYCTVLYSGAP